MLSDERAHSLSTGHSVMVSVVDFPDGNKPVTSFTPVKIEWMCCACPQRGMTVVSR